MTATIEIECDSYEDLQEILSEIKKGIRKHKKDIWDETQSEIQFDDSDGLGNLWKVDIVVFDEFERGIDRINNPSRYDDPGILTLNFEP